MPALDARPQAAELARRLAEPRRYIHAAAGPRQVGKTTPVGQLLQGAGTADRYASADEPALLRRLFGPACRHSGQGLSYSKMLGQLQDAGNTTTLAHYPGLLAASGMVTGLPKYAGDAARRRASSLKLRALNNALMTVASGLTLVETRAEPAP